MIIASVISLVFAAFIAQCAHALPTTIPGGHPNQGTLANALNLHDLIAANKDLKTVSPTVHQYGTPQMMEMLRKIGALARELNRAPVWVGDISLKTGGKLAQHLTHQRGLDADIAYLVHQPKAAGHRATRFHNRFTEQHKGTDKFSPNFDMEANYRVLKEVVSDPSVDTVYVGCDIFDAITRYEQGRGTDSIMKKIYAQRGHEDHFHVRISCPEGVQGCTNDWLEEPEPKNAKVKKPDPGKTMGADGKWRYC